MTPEDMADAVAAVPEPRVVVAAWTCFEHGRMLVVRAHGASVWFLPGGLVEPGETLLIAAAREAWEEVGVTIEPSDLEPLAVGVALAHGRPGVTAVVAVHVGPHSGLPAARGEIAEIGWIDAADRDRCAPAIRPVLDDATRSGLVTASGTQ